MTTRRQYEREYGEKYDRDLTTTQIAERFRADVKAAQIAGSLPSDLKMSVRTRYFSMGSSIDVRIKRVPAGMRIRGEGVEGRFSPEAIALRSTLAAMLAAYNHDGSDLQSDYFDVRFYGEVEFDWRLEEEARS